MDVNSEGNLTKGTNGWGQSGQTGRPGLLWDREEFSRSRLHFSVARAEARVLHATQGLLTLAVLRAAPIYRCAEMKPNRNSEKTQTAHRPC